MNRVRKAKAKVKAKEKTKRLTTRRCTAFTKIKNLSEDEVEQVMLQKKKSNPQREKGQNHARRKHQAKDPNRGMERARTKERSRAKRRARPNHNRRRAIAKERARERASRRKVSPPKEMERARAKTRKGFTGGESNKDGKVYVETIPFIPASQTLFRAFGG